MQQQKQPMKLVKQQQKHPRKQVMQQQKQPRKQRNNAIREVQKGDERAERPRKDNKIDIKRKETGGEVRDKWMRLQPGRERKGKRQNKQNEVKRTQKYFFRQKDKKREEAKQKESIDREK